MKTNLDIIEITDPADSRVAKYCLLKHKETIREHFIADHERTVLRLLESSIPVESLFVTKQYLQKHRDKIEKYLDPSAVIYLAEESVFLDTVGYPVHRGFLGVGVIPSDWDDPDMGGMNSSTIVAANGIVDAENLGSIIRTSAAFGIRYIVTDTFSCSPWLRRCVRVSMGNIFYVRIRRSPNFVLDLQRWKRQGYTRIGLSLPAEGLADRLLELQNMVFPEKYILILGNEANGLHPKVMAECDIFCTIPMNPDVDSLNVSHSLAVVLGQDLVQKFRSKQPPAGFLSL